MAWTYLSRAKFMKRVDDAMGIVYTHGIAGFFGGLMVGVFADPAVVVYHSVAGSPVVVKGWIYGHHPKQILIQFLAAITVIIWDALVTFVILSVLKIVFRGLRMSDEELEIGDLAIHDEEAYPESEGATRVLSGYGESSLSPAGAVPVGGSA
jgi:Amt family ammonium transporter